MRRPASKELLIVFGALQILRSEKVVAGEEQGRVDVTGHQSEIEIVGEDSPESRRICLVVVRIVLNGAPGWHQIGWRNGRVVGLPMGKIEIVIETLGGAAYPKVLVERAECPPLQTAGELRGSRPFLRDDIDAPAYGIGAVETALRPADDLDTVDVPGQDMLEIEEARRRIGRVDAIDEDLGLVRVCPADEDRSLSPWPAGLDDVEPWHVSQGIGQGPLLLPLNILFGDDGDAAADRALRRRQTSRRDDHRGQRDRLRERVAVVGNRYPDGTD